MRALAALGRLQPLASLLYLKQQLLEGCLVRLHALMTGGKQQASEAAVAALLEEVRVLIQVSVCVLLRSERVFAHLCLSLPILLRRIESILPMYVPDR